ncbi:Resolvase, N terminal domain [Raineyella antarctica]|uniref:Resolvase, N terminal domain n=1 Tax=Raineyella antarctica TaxID=1577474 RepID=A0A1G6GZM2_9ACTN|nr:recombinase family protein [Raineyella antarctica]SDB87343.1 Resolvase, N terminal domain [Raineyella antarctica]
MSSYGRKQRRTDDTPDKRHCVLYLRVSSVRQTHTAMDVDKDGNSIATQREQTTAKANEMNLIIAKEFVEPGVSAQTIEKRPVFRQMLAYVSEHPEVGYIIVYSRSRAFRNVEDAMLTRRNLRMLGVKLISTKEDFGDSIEGDAMATISDTMNELQNRLNGQDIKLKMAHKAKNGGTLEYLKAWRPLDLAVGGQ